MTIAWCASMATMGGTPMPGGWMLSMAWTRMCGQTWLDAGASFVVMWLVMMVAMMLPSLVPTLWRHQHATDPAGAAPVGWLTLPVAAGYFAVWTVIGAAVFVVGITTASAALRLPVVARTVPMATGGVVLLAGLLQFTRWKARHLACFMAPPGHQCSMPTDLRNAWRQGLRLGLHCSRCSAGPTAVLLVIGVMDVYAMAGVTAVITAERLAPAGVPVARVTGGVAVAGGLLLVAQAAGLG
ncbi:MAG: DUF2182 domain-containing protein [Burkholderiales bacterium]|nr:DUF2182 domain-containing protein [Burkholderiales bacterium]